MSLGRVVLAPPERRELKRRARKRSLAVELVKWTCHQDSFGGADVKTLIPVVKRMRERFRLREITVVADRGMVSQATPEAFEKSDHRSSASSEIASVAFS